MKIDVAIGRHRYTKTWQNKQFEWQEFVERCRKTHRTTETIAEYMAADKEQQSNIKDVGSFVPGHLVNGSRTIDKIKRKPMLALDADFAHPDLWERFKAIFGTTSLIYSTHKHTPERPRLRLCILTDRPMARNEYEPVCRYVTNQLGIDQFDPTTYEVNRLMYWPSTSKDGEFVFDSFDGMPLCVDAVLGKYHNWWDTSEWPIAESEIKRVKTGITKQGDPTEKPGVVGLFCRTYGIAAAIDKFLPDVYEPAGKDRYTYTGGSTAGGLIIYNDLFAYSHHGTDPTSGRLCNSFDLVRLHKFDSLDENALPDTPINRTPSYAAMTEFVMKDPEVKRLNMTERVNSLQQNFGTVELGSEELNWMGKLDMSKRGEILVTYDNTGAIMRLDSSIKGRILFNEFTNQVDIRHPFLGSKKAGTYPMDDDDERRLRVHLGQAPYNMNAGKMIADLYPLIAMENAYHPVRQYLESLTWDNTPRVDTLLIDYLGAEDTELNRAIIRKWTCAAVTRVYQPGTKFDHVLTLVGKEGTRKSTFFRSLGLTWFNDTFNFGMLMGGNGVRAYEQMKGKWIIEIPEMSGLKKIEDVAAKAFLGASEDSYRVSYGKHTSTFKRQSVFGATTNSKAPLTGQNGNRRFWVCDVALNPPKKEIEGELIPREEVNQIWAEVMIFWKDEPLHLSAELETRARELQEGHTEEDTWHPAIEQYLDVLIPQNWYDDQNTANHEGEVNDKKTISFHAKADFIRQRMGLETGQVFSEISWSKVLVSRKRVTVAEIWYELLGSDLARLTKSDTNRIRSIMGKMKGWTELPKKVKHLGGLPSRVFERAPDGSG